MAWAEYAALAESGFFPKAWLDQYCQNGSPLTGHINHHGVPGVEVSSGSLGHGLPIGRGIALPANAMRDLIVCLFCLAMANVTKGQPGKRHCFATSSTRQLGCDCGLQQYRKSRHGERGLDLDRLTDKWRAFRWSVKEVDGNISRSRLKLYCRQSLLSQANRVV